MDIHEASYQSFVIHQLTIAQLEMFWAAYKQSQHVMAINDAIEELDLFTEPSDDPEPGHITAQEIKTFRLDMTKLTSFRGIK